MRFLLKDTRIMYFLGDLEQVLAYETDIALLLQVPDGEPDFGPGNKVSAPSVAVGSRSSHISEYD